MGTGGSVGKEEAQAARVAGSKSAQKSLSVSLRKKSCLGDPKKKRHKIKQKIDYLDRFDLFSRKPTDPGK